MAEPAPAIAVCAVDFGWGSSGKLDAIAGALAAGGPLPRIIVLGSSLGRSVLGDVAAEAWYEHWPQNRGQLQELLARHGVGAALVVLDPEAASRIEDAGTPCVYVDSLPYLWTDADPLPTTVSAYCAQLSLSGAGTPTTLQDVENLTWVGPIVRVSEFQPRDAATAVLNVGGLHSPGYPSGNSAYLRLVLPAAVHALRRAGFAEIHVCGNVEEADVGEILGAGAVTSVGAHSHARFLELVNRAGVLVTSPGLTTLLEAMHVQTPTVCLPPQNVSQLLNAEQFAAVAGRSACVGWPAGVLNIGAVNVARADGELAALRVMADALDAADASETTPPLTSALFDAVTQTVSRRATVQHPSVGRDGAAEVAAIVRGLLDAAIG